MAQSISAAIHTSRQSSFDRQVDTKLYEDYDANFRTICQAMKSCVSQRMQTAAAERQEAAPNTQEELAAIRRDFLGVGH